jgi:hypothetical protein
MVLDNDLASRFQGNLGRPGILALFFGMWLSIVHGGRPPERS